MTLQEFINECQEVIDQYPVVGDIPVLATVSPLLDEMKANGEKLKVIVSVVECGVN